MVFKEKDSQAVMAQMSSGSRTGSGDEETLINELVMTDPIQQTLTGGGTCRYCVNQCPQN